MKKLTVFTLVSVLILSLFAGCSGTPAPETSAPDPSPSAEATATPAPESTAPEAKDTVTLATLKGPTTMGLVKLLDDASNGLLDYEVENTIYGAADEITALLISGQVDMAAIPCNLASVLYNKTEGKIVTAAVNTLGVLSVVELGDSVNSIADLAGKTVYSTGKGTTPEYALNAILSANSIDPASGLTVEFKSEATEIAALLTGDSVVPGTIAVLPQPYATTVLLNNPDARIALDLTEEWSNAGIDGSLVTGVLVMNKSFADENPQLVESFLADYGASVQWVGSNTEDAAELIAALEIVPKAAVAVKALPYCNIVFRKGAEMKQDVSAYLSVLFEQNPASVGGALPGDDFYYGA